MKGGKANKQWTMQRKEKYEKGRKISRASALFF